jgi:hypothetical protein
MLQCENCNVVASLSQSIGLGLMWSRNNHGRESRLSGFLWILTAVIARLPCPHHITAIHRFRNANHKESSIKTDFGMTITNTLQDLMRSCLSRLSRHQGFELSSIKFSVLCFTRQMQELPTDIGIRALIFGCSNSGKSTYALEYAQAVLSENPSGGCLVFSHRSKSERKLIEVSDVTISDRIYYRWIHDRVSLIESASRLHEYFDEQLELLIVEDLLDFVHPLQAQGALACIANAVSVFPTCRLLVTLTPRSDTAVAHFRILMTHYVNTCGDTRRIGIFPKSLAKANRELRQDI